MKEKRKKSIKMFGLYMEMSVHLSRINQEKITTKKHKAMYTVYINKKLKANFYTASKKEISAKEIMTVKITDSENVTREYGILAMDVCNEDFANQQVKEHSDLYDSKISKIEVFTYAGKRFKTINF